MFGMGALLATHFHKRKAGTHANLYKAFLPQTEAPDWGRCLLAVVILEAVLFLLLWLAAGLQSKLALPPLVTMDRLPVPNGPGSISS
jgi:hypothetical protein